MAVTLGYSRPLNKGFTKSAVSTLPIYFGTRPSSGCLTQRIKSQPVYYIQHNMVDSVDFPVRMQ